MVQRRCREERRVEQGMCKVDVNGPAVPSTRQDSADQHAVHADFIAGQAGHWVSCGDT